MHTHVMTTGTSPVAVVNCVWALHEEYDLYPDHIVFLVTANNLEQFHAAKKAITAMYKMKNRSCTLDSIIIDETDISSSINTILDVLNTYGVNQETKVSVDFTAGRKTMSVALVLAANKFMQLHKKPIDMFYLHLKQSQKYRDILYSLVPRYLHKLVLLEGDM